MPLEKVTSDLNTIEVNIAVLHTEMTALRQEILQRDVYLQKALEIQAAEYLRRLSALNGEHDTLKDMSNKYLPRETFEGYKDNQIILLLEINKWRNDKEVEIAALKGRVTGSIFILATVWALVQAFISFFRGHI